MNDSNESGWSRRDFVNTAVAGAVLAATPTILKAAAAGGDKAAVLAQIPKQHAENIKRLQDWIALPSIAAENRNDDDALDHILRSRRQLRDLHGRDDEDEEHRPEQGSDRGRRPAENQRSA